MHDDLACQGMAETSYSMLLTTCTVVQEDD